MAKSGSNNKVANGLVAASAAAVLAVYSAGFARTRSAAAKLEAQSEERRPSAPEGASEGRGPASAPASVAANEAVPVTESSPNPAPVEIAAGERPSVAVPVKPVDTAIATDAPATAVPAPATPAPAIAAPVPAVAVAVAAPAPVVVPPPPAPAAPPAPKWKDGTFTGWGTSRHGDIEASVVIEGGRIVSANISQCLTRYSCNVIGRLPPEVPQRQSAEVDYVSGATQSTNAYYYAVTEALGKAKSSQEAR